jgi:hypothetical protein
MKRASKKPCDLSESLHRRLNSYALAASAAGVSALALAMPVEGKIVYTPAHHVIKENDRYRLRLNRSADFELVDFVNCSEVFSAGPAASQPRPLQCNGYLTISGGGNGIEGTSNASSFDAAAFQRGAEIGSQGAFKSRAVMCDVLDSSGTVLGHWHNVKSRYLGLNFVMNGKTHYGWARLSVKVQKYHITAVLTGYAYETVPNKPIIAGRTKGPDVVTVRDVSLGRLATGKAAN